jgi:hypothetical protein
MTTKAWTASLLHTTDAEFRAWGSDIAQALLDVGLVKTADTGQINWTTVARPLSTSNPFNLGGYEIWRYPDSSIYMKWEFGTGTQANRPAIRVTVSNGSNGSGTLTGVVSAARTAYANTSGGASRLSWMCLKDGFFGFLGYRDPGGVPQAFAFFAVARTTDANGATTSLGATVYWNKDPALDGQAAVQALNFSTSYVGAVNLTGDYCAVPHRITSSLVGVDSQAFVHFTAMPRVYPVMPLCTVISTEVATGSTFDVALVGATSRTYLALDTRVYGAATGTTDYKLAMLWE